MRTDKELKEIAKGLVNGEIFSDWQIKDPDDVHLIFQALTFLNDEQLNDLRKEDIGMIFEYKKEAAYFCEEIPVFVSFNCLTSNEAIRVGHFYQEYKKIVETERDIEI